MAVQQAGCSSKLPLFLIFLRFRAAMGAAVFGGLLFFFRPGFGFPLLAEIDDVAHARSLDDDAVAILFYRRLR
jgi:hypothetical protein